MVTNINCKISANLKPNSKGGDLPIPVVRLTQLPTRAFRSMNMLSRCLILLVYVYTHITHLHDVAMSCGVQAKRDYETKKCCRHLGFIYSH